MPGRKIRLTSGSSLIIVGTSMTNSSSKTMKGRRNLSFLLSTLMVVDLFLRVDRKFNERKDEE